MSGVMQLLRVVADPGSGRVAPSELGQVGDSVSVLTATTPAEALDLVSSGSVDCVVCDATVGSASGIDLLAAIRETDSRIPFFLVVGPDDETTVADALDAGVTDCLTVPFADTDRRLLANRILNAVEAASEADYRSLIEDVLNVSYVGTFVLDASFRVVWINDSIETYFGVDRGEILGGDKRELIASEIKHVFAEPDRFADRVIATYDDNSYVEQFECHILPTEGREDRWLEHQSYPITTGPYAGGRIEHYVDVTARKQRDQELDAERVLLDRLFETSPVGIVLLNGSGEIVRANSHAEVVLGLAQSEITERRYDDPEWEIHDEDGEPIPSEDLPFARALRTGEPVFNDEHAIRLPDGTQRWLSINASPLAAADGTVGRVVCAIADITTIRESERELVDHNERLAEFASIVSHDLRNPLNVLSGSLELAEETGETVHFERAYRAIGRMNQLIGDLLTLARAGEEIARTETVALGQLATDCWSHLSTGEAALRIETDRTITADESRLTQLLENLFRNSVEHGGEGVTITVGDLPDGFVVADDGPGIPDEHRDHVFERGYSSTRGGTGLGLYIVERIAEAHGWTVALADTDTGTRIEVTGISPEALD